MLTPRNAGRGFTLIELMIGLGILAFLLMLAAPSFGAFLQNQKIRAKAEALLAGLQTARTEAIRLNTPVQFLLTDSEPEVGNVSTAVANTSGPHWMVRGNVIDPDTQVPIQRLLEGQFAGEGSNQAEGTAPLIELVADSGTVTFTPFGGTATGGDRFRIRPADSVGQCVADGGSLRCLDITVSTGGQIRMCDPFITADGDSRKC